MTMVSSSGPRVPDAEFIASHLVPFCHRVADLLVARRAGSARGDLRPIIGELHRSALESGATIAVLVRALDLDETDLAILALGVAPYLDPEMGRRYKELQPGPAGERLPVGLVLELLGATDATRYTELARFQPDRSLFRDQLLTLEPAAGAREALFERPIWAPQTTIDRLLGWPRIDDRIRPFCVLEQHPVRLESVVLPERRRTELLSLVRRHEEYRTALRRLGFARTMIFGRGVNILFAGPAGTGKSLLARAVANTVDRPLLRVFSDRLVEAEGSIEGVVAGIFREATLTSAIVFFDDCESLFGKRNSKLAFLLSELERFEGITILATNAPQALDDVMDRRIMLRLDFELPSAEERLHIWELHLPPEAPIAEDVDLPLLASLFAFAGGTIKNAVLVALNRAIDRDPRDPIIDMALLRSSAESQLKFNLESLAHKSRVNLTLQDLVLPRAEREKVEEILSACRSRELVQNRWGFSRRLVTGRGLCLLFDGPPGTGKTLCAEIIGNVLDRAIYRIDVANVISKWVGETEKNIAQIFARAKSTNAILLFDEADSLFAKRTDVTSANDRFANQEVNLLLQEVERFDGIVILTTNLFGGLDDALKRRVQYRVTFPKPGPTERKRIWRTLIPKEAPLDPDVNLETLAFSYEFSGGNIKNAVLRAAYMAAGGGGAITMDHLVAACRRESETSGMLFREVSNK